MRQRLRRRFYRGLFSRSRPRGSAWVPNINTHIREDAGLPLGKLQASIGQSANLYCDTRILAQTNWSRTAAPRPRDVIANETISAHPLFRQISKNKQPPPDRHLYVATANAQSPTNSPINEPMQTLPILLEPSPPTPGRGQRHQRQDDECPDACGDIGSMNKIIEQFS